jgi:hypothetical protein
MLITDALMTQLFVVRIGVTLLESARECATEDAVALGEALIAACLSDDVAAVSFSPEGLQRHDTVVAWLRKWRMAANTVKSQTMIIHPRLMSRLQ